MRILLVRHGQSEWNAIGRLQGQADAPLSDHGRVQARALREDIARLAPTRAVTSDLQRVRDTVAELGHGDAVPTRDLREFGIGTWTGKLVSEVREEDEDAYLAWRAGDRVPPEGEPWSDFVARTSGVIEALREGEDETVLVACHGGVIRALMDRYIGLPTRSLIPVANASLTILRFDDGQKARLELFNYRPRLMDIAG